MRVTHLVPLALIAIAIGCSRSALDVAGVVGQDSGVAFEGTPTGGDGSVVGDDTSVVGNADGSSVHGSDGNASASDAHGAETDASGQYSDTSEVGSEAEGGEGDGSASDASPELPCLERPTVDCDCLSDVCSSQSVRLGYAIRSQVATGCYLACLNNYFTFDANGCVTGYSHYSISGEPTDDACVLQALGKVRFSCATGVSQPVSVYHSCTIAM